MSTEPQVIVEAQDLAKDYGNLENPVHALAGVSFKVHKGDFVSIMGQSGSGKSTLLHIIGLLHQSTRGSYLLEGRRVEELDDKELTHLRGRRVGIVFQRFNLLPAETILDNVQLPLVYMRVSASERRERGKAVLSAMGLKDRMTHLPTQLSGGQLQRAAIARALITDPAIVLADEPTGNLDSESGRIVMGIFRALNEIGRTIIQVTHDSDKALYANRILHIKDGLLDSDEMITNPTICDAQNVNLSFLDKDL